MTLPALPFGLEKTVFIRARRDTVFRYFTDSERFAAWWGPGSTIDSRPGGRVVIRYPGGQAVASGEVVEIRPGARISFTYGYEGEGKSIPPGGSLVTVVLEDRPEGTFVRLQHDVGTAAIRDEHVAGWRFQLSRFAVVVAAEQHAGAAARVDGWFAAFSEPDAGKRRALLDEHAAADVVMLDEYASIRGREELSAHIAAAHVHLTVTIAREGDVRQCQGHAMCRWKGGPMSGTNLFELDADGRIARVVGFWGA